MVYASLGACDLAWTWGLDDGPSKSAADAAEAGSWGCQVDSQEMGEVAASWEAERGSIT